MKLYYLVLVLLCFVFYSCAASETETAAEITFTDLKEKVNANAGKLKSLDAYGEISIDSPTLNNTGSITVSINKPDSVYTKLEGPFGLDVADLLITRDNFVYYNVMENKVIRGPSTNAYLSIIMKIKIDFDDLINAFSGKFTFNEDEYPEAAISSEGNNYIVTQKGVTEIKKYWINSEFYYVTKLGKYDMKGNTIVEILYENFFQSDDIHFPKKISINRPQENQNIWLTYYNEEFNNNKLTYKLKIPKSAKQIDW